MNLSSPRGSSINDGIDPALCSLHYLGLDAAVAMVKRLGPGCQLAKLDLQHAYRVVPVHPDDWHLLGMQGQQQVILDTMLPFGLRSATKIFSALADGLLWSMACNGIMEGLHYLDDFLFGGRPLSEECQMDDMRHLSLGSRLPRKDFGIVPRLPSFGYETSHMRMRTTVHEEHAIYPVYGHGGKEKEAQESFCRGAARSVRLGF